MAEVEMILGTGAISRELVPSRLKSRRDFVSANQYGVLVFLSLLLCLCAFSWGSCRTYTSNCPLGNTACENAFNGNYNGSRQWKYTCLTDSYGLYCGPGFSTSIAYVLCSSNEGDYLAGYKNSTIRGLTCTNCSSRTEADSVACVIDPTRPNCAVVSDTLLFACSESLVNGQPVATIYRLSCKATNGEVTECNGKQNIDISTDGQPVKQMQGTCSQNGLPVGPFGGASPQDSTDLPNGANAECFAITGGICHMRDKVSGNTFTCGCDGSCQVAILNLMAGSADCSNPYPQPTSASDSISFPSSPSSSPSSSESGGESSPSSSGEGGNPDSSDFEYDYNAVLEAIRANTQYTGNEVNDLNGKAIQANEYLREIANKDWNPIINVSPPIVNVGGDTNIINVQGGDTSRAGADIFGWLKDNNYSVDTSERALWRNYADSIKNAVGIFNDSMETDDTTWKKNADSLSGAGQGMRTAFNAFVDTIGNSAFNDTLDAWRNTIVNNGVLQGQGSNSCPSILTREFTLEIPFGGSTISARVGSIGRYICTPIAGLSITIWALGRTLIRFLVAFTCMMWLYRAVCGSGNSGEDDE